MITLALYYIYYLRNRYNTSDYVDFTSVSHRRLSMKCWYFLITFNFQSNTLITNLPKIVPNFGTRL